MRRSFIIFIGLGLIFLGVANANPIFGAFADTSTLGFGSDPFSWAGSSVLVVGQTDGSAPSSCGVNCADYTFSNMTLEIASTLTFSVASPALMVTFNTTGDSSLQFTGIINVSSDTAQFDLNIALPQGTLDSTSLTTAPTFPLTAIDAANSAFAYGIDSPPSDASIGVIGINDGLAQSVDPVPEPASISMFAGGLAIFGLLARRMRTLRLS